jgi:hypothetical protein
MYHDIQIIDCPDAGCGAPAEIVDRWQFASTDGPLEHLKTRCLDGHGFTVLVEPLTLDEALSQILAEAPVSGGSGGCGPAVGAPFNVRPPVS